ncbi:YmL10 [Emydomyces testavorans]|uniref:YmL10 n=1 Tax=Emydomyces testavorans TaxID=2070801 RepID=A0AAF0IL85_9EURO|nr:YmL10 [Emydomyces testavorans]
MPPRLPWRLPPHLSSPLSLLASAPQLPSTSCSPFLRILLPFFLTHSPSPLTPSPIPQPSQNRRHASILGSLSDNAGAYNKRIRRGRGPASGKGKTSGRGHKGQKQHGKVPAGFNGGQTKDIVVHGERGFENIFSPTISKVNIDRIQDWIDQGRLDPARPITLKELVKSRCIHGIKDGVKLLGGSRVPAAAAADADAAADAPPLLKQPINIIVSRASASAIAAVEAAGGSVVTRYYTRHAIRRILSGRTDAYVSLAWAQMEAQKQKQDGSDGVGMGVVGMGMDKPRVKGEGFQYRLPDPTARRDIEYYRDPAHRGYLSYLVGEGEGPSLFFRPPGGAEEEGAKKKKKRGSATTAGENRVW